MKLIRKYRWLLAAIVFVPAAMFEPWIPTGKPVRVSVGIIGIGLAIAYHRSHRCRKCKSWLTEIWPEYRGRQFLKVRKCWDCGHEQDFGWRIVPERRPS